MANILDMEEYLKLNTNLIQLTIISHREYEFSYIDR